MWRTRYFFLRRIVNEICLARLTIGNPRGINNYIATQVILAFSLVLAYDLLEDRRTIDVSVTKFFSPCFKMAERFENLDNILRDWAKDKVQKSLAEELNRFEMPENER